MNEARPVGRGSTIHPPNRFEATQRVPDWEQWVSDEDFLPSGKIPTTFLPDATQSILSHNQSPDIPFDHSLNPYRGCEHGCAYCYARPSHEWLGWNAGLDFETKILVKHDAARLLREALDHKSWRGELLALSGVTDCYQPIERQLGITRQCLEVVAEYRQGVEIITKNALLVRDLDLLAKLAEQNLVRVNLSLTTLDSQLARELEPRTSQPAARLRAIRELTAAGVPTRVMVAPVIPGLNDHEIPSLLAAAAEAGAVGAGWILLRLPLTVAPVFQDWLQQCRPELADRVLARIRETRAGGLSDSQFGIRMRGQGAYAAGIQQTFTVFARKYHLDRSLPPLDLTQFRRPPRDGEQRRLFEA